MKTTMFRHRWSARIFLITCLHLVVFACVYALAFGIRFDFFRTPIVGSSVYGITNAMNGSDARVIILPAEDRADDLIGTAVGFKADPEVAVGAERIAYDPADQLLVFHIDRGHTTARHIVEALMADSDLSGKFEARLPMDSTGEGIIDIADHATLRDRPQMALTTMLLTLPAVLLLKITVFYLLGHCHGWSRSVTFSDLSILLKASLLSVLAIAALDSLSNVTLHIPRLVLALDFGMTVLILGGVRCAWRLSREAVLPMFSRGDVRRAFIVGANATGESFVRMLKSEQRLNYDVVGFLDEDKQHHGMRLAGIPVVGGPSDAPRFAQAFSVTDVLVVSGQLTGKRFRGLVEGCESANLKVKVLPALDDLLNRDFHVHVRDVDINDLLRREPVQLNSDEIGSLLADRTILVTGAGGSIGSEICRQVLRFRPTTLVLVERAENSLFLIEQELGTLSTPTRVVPCIADITDADRMDGVLDQYRPDVVFHAAAHKHVPLMEYNPAEAIKNNVLGTRQLAEMADQHGVKEFVLISTDKAVNPTSIMGVSKQLAERFVHAFSETSATKFVVVRFGNVLGSAGSVVPIFTEQIRRGGPITVTHPDIERYFMTIPEASQLVLQAAAMGNGGEIFVLDMGEAVKIVDLARDLIQLSGLDPDDIEIKFTGLRPGEKLYEELYFDNEETLATPHPKLFVAYHRSFSMDEVGEVIMQLTSLLNGPPDRLIKKLKELMPEYDAKQPVPQADVVAET